MLKAAEGHRPSYRSKPQLYDAILAFLAVKRTDRQMERLLTRLSECHCQMDERGGTVRQHHELGTKRAKTFLSWGFLDDDDECDMSEVSTEASNAQRTFPKSKCAFMVDFFHSLQMPLFSVSRIKTTAKGSSSSWHVSSSDLIPFGADIVAQSLLRWYRFVPDTMVLGVMASILRVCNTLVVPSFIKYRYTDVFVRSTRLMVDRTMAELRTPQLEIRTGSFDILEIF